MQKKKPDYKWVIMVLGMLTTFTALGFCSSNRSLFLKAITGALGIPRSLYSISDTCRYVSTAVLNIFFGRLISKWGERKMLAFGFLSLIVFCLLFSVADGVWLLYLAGLFLGTGLAWTSTTIVGFFVGKWFKENKGTIMGIVLAANGLGSAVSSQVLTPIIHNEAAGGFGYRNAYRLIALIVLVVGAVVVAFFKDTPDAQQRAPEKSGKKKRGISWDGISQKEALRKGYFYAASVCVFLMGATLQSISGVAQAHLEDVGMDTSYIALVFSLHGLCLASAKILAGVSYDHLGIRRTVLICNLAAVVSMLSLSFVTAESYGLATIYEIVFAFAVPMETVMLPLLANDLFGSKDYARMLGLFVAVNTAGYALGSPAVNLVYDATGSYKNILQVLSLIMAVITVCMQLILRRAEQERLASQSGGSVTCGA